MKMIQGLIDGAAVQTTVDMTILEAARSIGLNIPTLCHHPGLPEEGGCRLCLVEISFQGGAGKLVASCMYPLRDNGFEISTSSVAVRKARRFVLELLINRCPSSPHLLALADEYGASPEPRFLSKSPEMKSGEEVLAPREKLCILCGRCARACLISGGAAIGLAGRGRARKATGPFFREPEACVGCLACASVCPTGAIWGEENKGFRRIWGREFELAPCTSCGRKFATEAQIRIGGLLERLCPDCRRLKTASGLKDALCCSAIR